MKIVEISFRNKYSCGRRLLLFAKKKKIIQIFVDTGDCTAPVSWENIFICMKVNFYKNVTDYLFYVPSKFKVLPIYFSFDMT